MYAEFSLVFIYKYMCVILILALFLNLSCLKFCQIFFFFYNLTIEVLIQKKVSLQYFRSIKFI